ncbi:MAG: hypothetical protein Q8910_19675, partial [Bacteroidota bacterium]|nr:hypothetical protein [Bacteroidota bacterium]
LVSKISRFQDKKISNQRMKNFPQTPSYLENKHGTPSDVIKNYVENQGDKEEKEAYKQIKILDFG